MAETPIHDLDWDTVPSPCYVVDTRILERNAQIMAEVATQIPQLSVLLALKGFALWAAFPLLRPFLSGCCASGPLEARLAREEMGGEVHAYAPAFSDVDLADTLPYADHLVFNSPGQVRRHLATVRGAARPMEIGLRVNPGYAEVEVELYNPCAPCSRLGCTREALDADPGLIDELDGLHLHVLCEQGAETLARVVAALESNFGDVLSRVRWLNLGGGHWVTKPDYNRPLLIETLRGLLARYPNLERLYLEPGEAWAVDTGVLVTQVEDLSHNSMPLAILDCSATAHMPDVLEMPYRPTIHGAGDPGQFPHTYRLGGLTCLAGDVIGDWSFPEPLRLGQKLVFADMTHYTMVKTTQFNGVRHPSIALWDGADLRILRRFGYEDYRNRLS
ncbi:MAG: carboxynorspermidine decarboxylase [Planctomycetota bacterium]|nr:MAG: carboxynorspermidine decarboxylase [Planctomycetota bacterium]